MNQCTNKVVGSCMKIEVQGLVFSCFRTFTHTGLAALLFQPAWMLHVAVRVDVWVFLIDVAVSSSVTALSAHFRAQIMLLSSSA